MAHKVPPIFHERMKMIGLIREWVSILHDEGRFELVKEILGDVHPNNFSGVTDDEVRRMFTQMFVLHKAQQPIPFDK